MKMSAENGDNEMAVDAIDLGVHHLSYHRLLAGH